MTGINTFSRNYCRFYCSYNKDAMKKYMISILWILNVMLAFNSNAEPQINNCNCHKALWGFNPMYRKAWIGDCTEKSHPQSYPYYLISASIKSKMVSDPSYYFEYYHNLQVFNEALVNYLNYKMNESETWPTLFGKKIDDVRKGNLEAIEINYETDQYVKERARIIYQNCYRLNHYNPMILYDNSFLEFSEGNSNKSAELAEKYISLCKDLNIDHQSSSAELMLLGQSHIEMAQYFKAIEVLSELIQKDPTDKEAHFHRATAYFEIGNYDEALADFARSDEGKKISRSNVVASNEFIQALISSAHQGASESAVGFVPSLCSSVYGLSKTLWTIHWSANPLNQASSENIKKFANASYEMGQCIVNYCKNVEAETIDGYVDQIKILYKSYDQLSDQQKGELIGYTIGKYGVEIVFGAVTGTAAGKGVQYANKMVPLFRNLRNANRVCNFEIMLLSEAKKKAIVSSSLAHATEREVYFKNIKIQWDRQNKHIPGAHNFKTGKGTILIEKSELETLIKENAGKGQRVAGPIFEPNFKERVDFGKIIGEYALESKGKPTKYIPTTKGIIHYDKNGSAHVIPSDPFAIME